MVLGRNSVIVAASKTLPSFAFVLQPEFPMNAFVLATEALRIANQNSGQMLFEWKIVSENGEPVRASNGLWISPDQSLADMQRTDFLVVLEGNLPTQNISPPMLAALRSAHRHGAMIVGVDTGAFAIAAAGLIGERELVLHWEAISSYLERHPDADVRNQLFLIDRQLAFCAGGVATLDLMLELISGLRGAALAREVANALIHTPRDGSVAQRPDDGPTEATQQAMSRTIVTLMEEHLDFPLAPKMIAKRLGISVRTLERYCLRQFNQTPKQLYLRVRLQAARNFLFYEEREIKDIAVACGFSYPSVFTRAFAAQFGLSPSKFRQAFRDRQKAAVRPEIVRMALTK